VEETNGYSGQCVSFSFIDAGSVLLPAQFFFPFSFIVPLGLQKKQAAGVTCQRSHARIASTRSMHYQSAGVAIRGSPPEKAVTGGCAFSIGLTP